VPELHFSTSLFRPRAGELSFPVPLRFCLAREARLFSEVLGLFVRALFAFQRRTARRLGVPGPLTGAVAFVQRFGSALQFAPHFHVAAFRKLCKKTPTLLNTVVSNDRNSSISSPHLSFIDPFRYSSCTDSTKTNLMR
jgi:hypothetical protein